MDAVPPGRPPESQTRVSIETAAEHATARVPVAGPFQRAGDVREQLIGQLLGDDALGAWSVTREVYDDGGTGRCHRLRDAGTDALGRAGDDRNLTSQGTGRHRVL